MRHIFTAVILTCSISAHSAETESIEGQVAEVDTEAKQKQQELEELKKTAADIEANKAKVKKAQAEIDKLRADIADGSQFAEFGFGLGFGNVFLSGDGDIKSAVVDTGVVRITEQNKNKLGVWLTTSWVNDSWPSRFVNFGPFLGVQLGGNDNIVDSIAVGADFSFRRIAPELPLDFQIGWAWTRVDSLASGYTEGATLPAGTSQVLLKHGTDDGPVLIVSYNFGRRSKEK